MVEEQLHVIQLALEGHELLVQSLGIAHDLVTLGVVRLAPGQDRLEVGQVRLDLNVVCSTSRVMQETPQSVRARRGGSRSPARDKTAAVPPAGSGDGLVMSYGRRIGKNHKSPALV